LKEAKDFMMQADYVISTNQEVILFPDNIVSMLLSLPTTEEGKKDHKTLRFENHAAFIVDYKNDIINPFDAVCIFHQAENIPLKCGFGEQSAPNSVYSWISGRCQPSFPSSVYYLRNDKGPFEMLRNEAARIYDDYRLTGLVCSTYFNKCL